MAFYKAPAMPGDLFHAYAKANMLPIMPVVHVCLIAAVEKGHERTPYIQRMAYLLQKRTRSIPCNDGSHFCFLGVPPFSDTGIAIDTTLPGKGELLPTFLSQDASGLRLSASLQ